LNYKLNYKLRDFKNKLINIWYLLPYFNDKDKDIYTFGLETEKKYMQHPYKVRNLEELYLKKEQEID